MGRRELFARYASLCFNCVCAGRSSAANSSKTNECCSFLTHALTPFIYLLTPFSRTIPPPPPYRRRQKENQEDLLQRVNQATLDMLNKSGSGSGGGNGQGRKISDISAYKSVADMHHNNTLTVQVDHRSECVLVPIYGMLVPFHILTVKNASNNQVRDCCSKKKHVKGYLRLLGPHAASSHASLLLCVSFAGQ